jgi:hypothetical protein
MPQHLPPALSQVGEEVPPPPVWDESMFVVRPCTPPLQLSRPSLPFTPKKESEAADSEGGEDTGVEVPKKRTRKEKGDEAPKKKTKVRSGWRIQVTLPLTLHLTLTLTRPPRRRRRRRTRRRRKTRRRRRKTRRTSRRREHIYSFWFLAFGFWFLVSTVPYARYSAHVSATLSFRD